MARNTTSKSVLSITRMDDITPDNVMSLSADAFDAIVSADAVKGYVTQTIGSVRGAKDATVVVKAVDALAVRTATGGSADALRRMARVFDARADIIDRSASDIIRAAWRLGMIGRGKTYTPRALADALNVTPSLVSQMKPTAEKGAAVKGAGRKPNRDKSVKGAASIVERDALTGILATAAGLEALTSEDNADALAVALSDEDGIRAARAIIVHAATLAGAVDALASAV